MGGCKCGLGNDSFGNWGSLGPSVALDEAETGEEASMISTIDHNFFSRVF